MLVLESRAARHVWCVHGRPLVGARWEPGPSTIDRVVRTRSGRVPVWSGRGLTASRTEICSKTEDLLLRGESRCSFFSTSSIPIEGLGFRV